MVNPFAGPIFIYASRISAAVAGRFLRKWWRRQPAERKGLISKHISNHKWKYVGITGIIGGSAYDSYRQHIFLTPFTGRERFMLCSQEEIMEIQIENCKQILNSHRKHIYPANHPEVLRLKNIVQSIIRANKDIPKLYNKYWTIFIIDSPNKNCLVLENGCILMFRGMLDALDNNIHQTATVLAHEMSHVLLDHNTEKFSDIILVENLMLLPCFLLWAFLPTDFIALFYSFFFGTSVTVLHNLPNSRTIEEEADVVGLFLMASACYDVREASAFWGKMDICDAKEGKKVFGSLDWFSTHPSHQNRQHVLNNFMKEAIHIRNLKRCARLKGVDPRRFIKMVQEHYPESTSITALNQLSLRDDFPQLDLAAESFIALKSK